MRQLLNKCFGLKKVVFVSCALAWSVFATAQTTPPAAPSSDDDMESDTTTSCCAHAACHKCDAKFIVFADFGGSTLFNTVSGDGSATSAYGLSWAISGQYAHQFNTHSPSTRLFLSYGLELRNFNGTLSSPDGFGSTAYNNYHYWYAGVPLMFQVVDVRHRVGNLTDVGFYAQCGISVGFKLNMLDVYSIQGNNSWNDVSSNYTTVMLQHYVSAGVAYRTRHNTYLLGPYVGYVMTNISNIDGVNENVLSYGARLSVLLFK